MKPQKRNIITAVIIVTTFILAAVGIFTALRLYQLRDQAVAPNAPQSKLFAWDCDKYTFNISSNGQVSIENASDKAEPAQKADVLIDNAKVSTLDVPGLGPRSSKTILGQVDVPISGNFTWKVLGSLSCQNEGSFGKTSNATASDPACNPPDIMLVIDRSSTMNAKEADGRTKLAWAKDAATQFVDVVMSSPGNTTKIGVSSFGAQGNDGTGQLSAANNSTLHTALSSSLTNVKQAISSVNFVHSGTCIECGLRIANTEISSSSRKKAVILLSDGKANHVWNGTTADSKQKAITAANNGRTSGISYYVLGYGKQGTGDIDETTLKAIAGNQANYQYKPDVADWAKAFLNILDQICLEPTPTVTATATATASPTATATSTPIVQTSTPLPNLCTLNFSLTSPTATTSPTASPTSTPTTTASPTASPTATPTTSTTSTPTATATASPIATKSPIAIKTPTPTSVSLPEAGISLPSLTLIFGGALLAVIAIVLAL